MANKGKRMLFEDEYRYLEEVMKNNPDPSDIGGGSGETITINEIPTTLSADDLKSLQDNMNTRIKYDGQMYLQYNRYTDPEFDTDTIYLRNYKTSTIGDNSDCLVMWNSILVNKNGQVNVDNSENRNKAIYLRAGNNVDFTYGSDSVIINATVPAGKTYTHYIYVQNKAMNATSA